jgi:hypothetical protein
LLALRESEAGSKPIGAVAGEDVNASGAAQLGRQRRCNTERPHEAGHQLVAARLAESDQLVVELCGAKQGDTVKHGGERFCELPERLVTPAGRPDGERLGDSSPQAPSAVLRKDERSGRAARAPGVERLAECRQRRQPLRARRAGSAPLLPATRR